MLMAETAYSTENEDHEVVEFLLAGFTGVLRGGKIPSMTKKEDLSKIVSTQQQEKKTQYID